MLSFEEFKEHNQNSLENFISSIEENYQRYMKIANYEETLQKEAEEKRHKNRIEKQRLYRQKIKNEYPEKYRHMRARAAQLKKERKNKEDLEKKITSLISESRNHSKERKIEFFLTKDDIYEQLILQSGKCALTGRDLYFGYFKDNTISIDRIDSNKSYSKDNIQLVTKTANISKHAMTYEYYVELCRDVVKTYEANNC